MQGIVPVEVFSRPKRGFQVPLADWFRGELKGLFEERCLASGAKIQEFCRVETMKKYLELNQRGADHGNRLWMLLSLATWLERI
jgi:asparagine synthase (glutamine-hydrolysing)